MDALTFLSGEGSWKLRPHEEKVLDAALGSLADRTREEVRTQLAQRHFVERIPEGRINVFRFYDIDNAYVNDRGWRITDPAFADLLFKVQIEVNGRKQQAHVTFYKGFVFSIEFKRPGRFYAGKDITVLNVERGKPSQTYTRVLDRAEHGPGEP